MALTTIAFCRQCKWRSSANPHKPDAAGADCPGCGSGVSALHCDPEYVGTDHIGRPYVEADAINEHLAEAGVPIIEPVGIATP
jgi:hypothetical protein